jgi:hypothetical protein
MGDAYASCRRAPTELSVLLIGTSALAVLAIATFTLPYITRRTQIGALAILAAVLGLVLVVIADLDGKYDGLIRVENEDFVIVEELMSPRYESRYPGQPLPCDTEGLPV